MRKRINKRFVNSTKSAEKQYFVWDTDLTGFGLKVTPAGRRVYVLQYRIPGKGRSGTPKRITIGRHGDLTPDQARDIAGEMLLKVKARRGSQGRSTAGRREVLKLEWANVDLEIGRAKLLRTKAADEEYRQLPHEAVELLRRLIRIAGNPYVFPGRRLGTHMTTVKGPWQNIRKRAGLNSIEGLGAFRLHDLRHNVVSWDVSRGVPLEIAGKNVGHRSRDATEVYAHFAPDALKRAADERAAAMRQAVEGKHSR